MNILIVEDDTFLASQLKKSFEEYNFSNRVIHLSTYDEFLHMGENVTSFDIILLDINLGAYNSSGFDILDYIRQRNEYIPIVIISSHAEYEYLEKAFLKGAHDYIVKPFRARELQIRIERWFRNYVFSEYFSITKTLEYQGVIYTVSGYEFFFEGAKISLSKGSKYLFSLFIIHREKLLSYDFLSEKIWGYVEGDIENNLRIKIMRLKNSLREVGIDTWIHNVRGEGYMLKKISV